MNNLNKFCYVTILFLLIISSLQAENISGIINIYKPVIAFDYCENSVTITNSDSLKIGDKVLMIQMQGAIIDTTNTIQFGDLLDIRSSGLYEFGIIEKIVGNFITFKNVIINKYNDLNKKLKQYMRCQPPSVCKIVIINEYNDLN